MTVDWFLGHRINSTTEAYFKSNPKELIKRYKKVVGHLLINKMKIKHSTTKEYDELIKDSKDKEDKILIMQNQIQEMIEHNKERDEFLDDLMTKKKVVEKIFEDEK